MDSYPGATNINFLGQAAEGQSINTGGTTKVKSRVIDGFVKGPQSSSNLKSKVARGLHQRGQKAHTLMRGALKKPDGSAIKIQSLRPGFNPERELRAKQTAQHTKVERFGGFVSSQTNNSGKPAGRPALQGGVINRQAPKAAQAAAAAGTVMPSMVTSASHAKLERMLDEALTKANAHKRAMKYEAARHFWQKPGFFNKKRWTKLGIVLVLVLAASSFIAWQKVPQLSVKLAGMRAHIDASIPSYEPAGYAVNGPAKAIHNAVTIQYASADDKSKVYTVKEQPSNQDSSSLIADNSAPGLQVQTARANGIPIVIVQNKVMCVSNGVKTTITNRANLSPDELLNIAKGICA